MHGNLTTRRGQWLMLMIALSSGGCESEDERLANYAQQATAQQARQNERIADQAQALSRHSQELTAATHDLVEQDATARRELLQAQHAWQQVQQQEEAGLQVQRQQLVAERQAVATAAARDPVIAEAIISAGTIVAALAPLLITIYALYRLPEARPTDEILGEHFLASWGELHAPSAATSQACSVLPGSAPPGLDHPASSSAPESEPPCCEPPF
jgi:hypothetical protein